MPSLFDPESGAWHIGWPGRVSRHDLVYATPPEDPVQGLPIGNGEIGVLGWFASSQIVFAINKSDLWDDAPFGRFRNWHADEEETSTTLRHGCRMIVDFQLPVFDHLYLREFQARINLAEAAIECAASGPFGSISLRGFVDHASGVFVLEVDSRLQENVPLTIRLQRYGSRTFAHWYSQVDRNPERGLSGTAALADQEGAYLTHALTSGTFAVMGRVIATDDVRTACTVSDSHTAAMTVAGACDTRFTVLAAITSPRPDDPIPAARELLATAQATGHAALFHAHARAWKAFWLRSLLEFGDDYLDSLWHLTMFYAACSQRGNYPGRFINGLWGWNHDVQNWNFYFHWNQQQLYWPLNAAGHHDLVTAYLNYRWQGLPHAREDAIAAFHAGGAVVSDVCERRGYNSEGEFHNHTPVAQIAMDFWRQYQYTGDRDFLATQVWPYLREAACFFASLFAKGADGRYHAREGAGYEGWILLRDGVSELVYGNVLFAAALQAMHEAGVVEPRAVEWQEILAHLAPLPTVTPDTAFIRDGQYQRGWFAGDAATAAPLLAAGFGIAEQRWLTSFLPEAPEGPASQQLFDMLARMEGKPGLPDAYRDDLRCNDGIFPWVEHAAVFPSGLVGLATQGTDLFRTAANTVKATACPGMGWSPLGISLARLGLGRETRKVIDSWPMYWQFYANGWGHYGPLAVMKAESALPGCISPRNVQDTSLPVEEREQRAHPLRMHPFRHMGMEAMSVFATAINESLLQSHEGVIRVAPAVTADQHARFTLHARGGFLVSSEIDGGQPLWICLESRQGHRCRVVNPWPRAVIFACGRQIGSQDERTVEFPTVAGERYLLVPEASALATWRTVSVDYPRNDGAKTHASGYATLGLPELF